jgi:phosphoribosylformylglycinamidine synthase
VEKRLQRALLTAIQSGLVASAHDLSEGGLAVALAESCISGGLGAQVNVATSLRADHALFSESQSRVLLSVSPTQWSALEELLREHAVPATVLGTVVGEKKLSVEVNGKSVINTAVEALEKVWKDAIPCLMKS